MKPPYTHRQGQFLAFIHHYTTLHGRPPAEAEMADFFRVTPPSVHLMILTLERHGFITRVPGQARSIAVRLAPETLPPLQGASATAVIPPPALSGPPKPGEARTWGEEAAFMRLGTAQLEDWFAHNARNPLDESDFVRLLDVLVESFTHAGLGAGLVRRLRRHACGLYHRQCQAGLPQTTFEESVDLLFSYLSEPSRARWQEALLSGEASQGSLATSRSTPLGFAEALPPPLTVVQKRNQSILELDGRGVGHEEIARRFNLSRSNIEGIVRRSEEERRLAQAANALLGRIRQAADLDATWPAADLIDAVRPLPVTITRLKKHFEGLNTAKISLRLLMDMAIPDTMAQAPDVGPPLLKVEGVGKKGYWSVVNQLTSLDLGDRFKHEWRARLAILVQAWRILGPFPYST